MRDSYCTIRQRKTCGWCGATGTAWPASQLLHRQGRFVSNGSENGAVCHRVTARRARTFTADPDRTGASGTGHRVDRGALAAGQGSSGTHSFQTAQDRLVKGLRVAGAKSLEHANAYLEEEFVVWWNKTIAVVPASSDDAHRALGKEHSLAASLSYVENRQVSDGYTIQFNTQTYRIARSDVRAGLRGAAVRIEMRLDASHGGALRQPLRNGHRLRAASQSAKAQARACTQPAAPRAKSRWMENFHLTSPEKTALSALEAAAKLRSLKPIR